MPHHLDAGVAQRYESCRPFVNPLPNRSPAKALRHRFNSFAARRCFSIPPLPSSMEWHIKCCCRPSCRNSKRFPADFMFELTESEWRSLRSQFVTLEAGRGQHRKYKPKAFTEQGVAMLSSVLRSDRAIAVNIQIMRAFVRMRELIDSNRELSSRLDELEMRLESRLDANDEAIAAILSAIRSLMGPPRSRPIGFTADLGDAA
jgi:hypothetical protein